MHVPTTERLPDPAEDDAAAELLSQMADRLNIAVAEPDERDGEASEKRVGSDGSDGDHDDDDDADAGNDVDNNNNTTGVGRAINDCLALSRAYWTAHFQASAAAAAAETETEEAATDDDDDAADVDDDDCLLYTSPSPRDRG